MKCEVCGKSRFDIQDDQICCENCWAFYSIELKGCYPDDDGGVKKFIKGTADFQEWKDKEGWK